MDNNGTKTTSRPGPERRLSRTLPPVEKKELCEKSRFVFFGLSGSAGATTLAFAFADFISGLRRGMTVAVVELTDEDAPASGYSFDRMGMDKHFEGREYLSFYSLIARGLPFRGLSNMDGGVNWMLRVPGEKFPTLELTDFVRLAAGAEGEVVVCDIHGGFRRESSSEGRDMDEIRKILDDADRVFAVVDPLPSRMMADARKLRMIKDFEALGGDVVYIINKMNKGVNAREMRSFLKARNAVEIGFLDCETIYSAEYNCVSAYSAQGGAEALENSFKKMLFRHRLSMFM